VASRDPIELPGSGAVSVGQEKAAGLLGDPAAIPPEGDAHVPGVAPSRLALRRLRRNRAALAFGGLFLLIVVVCLLAPVYAHDVAHTGPNAEHINEQIRVGHRMVNVVSLIGVPTGPTWHGRFLLGADSNGRDLAVRLLYGGRTSLAVGAAATLITVVLATLLGLAAGFYRGWTDAVISRLLDIIWAYPVLLLAIALGVSLALGGITIGPLHINGSSILLPAFIIGVAYIPYVARPIRGQVLVLREREFVDAARLLAFSSPRILVSEILPNLASTLVVFAALQLAQSIILEAALSFLGAGVQPPNASWGTLLSSGAPLLSVDPLLTLAPAAMLILTCLSINIFGDGLRAALDPRARTPVGR
jgi:peptide/nickel transport system permease protein